MTAGTDALIQAFRPFVVDGIPSSGANEPDKTEIIAALTRLAVDIGAAQAGIHTEPTIAARDTYYATSANRGNLVYVNNNNGSATDPANGVYEYVSGAARLAQGFYAGLTAVVQPSVDDALAAAGFNLRSDALAFASRMTTGETTTVYGEASNATRAAVAGEYRLDGTAATVGEQIPLNGRYTKQASGSPALLRTGSNNDQLSGVQAGIATTAALSSLTAALSQIGTLNPTFVNIAVKKTAGAFVHIGTGVVTPNASYAIFSGPVRGGSTIRANRKSGTGNAGYVFRTGAGGTAVLPGALYPTPGTDIAVPANAGWIDFSVDVSASYPEAGPSMNPEFALVIWDTAYGNPPDYVSQGMIGEYAAHKRANRVARAHKPPKWDYYDVDEVTQGFLRNYLGNLQSNTGFDVVRVPCEYGTPLYVSHAMTGVVNAEFGPMWYDKDGNKLAYSGASVTANFDGTTNMVVTAQSASRGRITRGMVLTDVTTSLLLGGTTVVDGPEDGGPGNYTLSQAATGTATGSTVEARVYGQNVPIYPPKGACFVDINYNAANRGRLSISTSQFPSAIDVRNYIGWADIRRRLPWRTKQMAVLGNSIAYSVATNDNRFALNLEKGLRAYAAQVSPVPGRTFAQVLDATGGTYPASRGSSAALTSTDFANIDLCYIQDTTNSHASNLPLGNLGDTTTATFYGVMYDICITKLQTWRPAMRLALATDPRRFDGSGAATGNPTNSNGARLSDFADAVIAFCRAYGFICIDYFYQGLGANAVNKAALLAGDNLHPIAAGYSRMETFAVSEINRAGS